MQTEFSQDPDHEPDALEEAFAERIPGKPVRLRLQPAILRKIGKGQYRAWKDVHWTVELQTPEEALLLRDAMRLFFRALMVSGPETTMGVLRALIPTRSTFSVRSGAAESDGNGDR